MSETTYSDNNLTEGYYSYYVKTNYYGGETEASNQVTIQIGSSNYFNITATANPAEGGTVTGGGAYSYGETCTLTATANAGHVFLNWKENGNVVSTESSYTFTVTSDRSLVASFADDSSMCNIVFDLYDSYGDGWNGNKLVVSTDHGDYEEITLESGSSGTQTLMIEDGSHVVLGWILGSWTGECSFMVSYSNGNVIYYGSNMSSSFNFEFDLDCDEMPTSTVDITATANLPGGGVLSGAGEYVIGSICMLTATANEGYVFMYWMEDGQMVSSEALYSFTVTGSRSLEAVFSEANGSGLLSGVFTVGENTQVRFSKGNLLYRASSDTWMFAENQYDCMGSDNSNVSPDYSGWIDLYCWGTSGWNSGAEQYQPYSTSTNNASYFTGGSPDISLTGEYSDADWAYHNAIANGGQQAGLWRCLTHEEYIYLIETRDNASQKYAYSNVNGVNGLIILPDEWTLPDGLSFTPQSGNWYTNEYC